MKLISESELRELLIASERLARLDAYGVNESWDRYKDAMDESYATDIFSPDFGKSFEDWIEIDLDDLLKEYPDYNISEFDNYDYE